MALENMVVNHVRDLLVPLHLENALATSAAPYVKKGSRKTGVSGCVVSAQGYFDAIVSFDRLLAI